MQAEWAALRHRVAENQRRLAHLLAEFLRPEAPAGDDALTWIADTHRSLRQHVEPLLDQFEGLEIESGVTGRNMPSSGPRRRHTSVES